MNLINHISTLTHRHISILILMVALSMPACGEKLPASAKSESIQVNKAALTLKVGAWEQLTASLTPATADAPVFRWLSSDETVAVVADGRVEAVAPGTTRITVVYLELSATVQVTVERDDDDTYTPGPKAMYERALNAAAPGLQLNGVGQYTAEGLHITGKNNVVKLDRFYALAERMVQYRVNFSADARGVFRSSGNDFIAYVDVPNKRISMATTPVIEKRVDFLQDGRDYLIEVYHVYQQAKVRIVDVLTGAEAEITGTHDGSGGYGAGVVNPNGFNVGMQNDSYCFGLHSGASMLVKQMAVYALKGKVKLLIYGDSITQPEAYFPTADFPNAWTQRIISRLNGDAMSSGLGGAIIDTVQKYMKNELPFIRAEYVMVTIGTNGSNTEAKLNALVDYIKSQGAIPILNNIPSNEGGTQAAVNALIEQVRRNYNINGCRFDLATSLAGDGLQVDESTMYWENYTNGWGEVYHHPNPKGGQKMYEQTLIDIPELYE